MKKIGLFWGSSTDNTTTAALFMKEYLEMNDHVVEVHNIEETDVEKILEPILTSAPVLSVTVPVAETV